MLRNFIPFLLLIDLGFEPGGNGLWPEFPLYKYIERQIARSTREFKKLSFLFRNLFGEPPLLLPQLGSEVFTKVSRLKHRTNLDVCLFSVRIRATLQPLHCFIHGTYLP